MTPTRDDRPVAEGTWSSRGLTLKVPSIEPSTWRADQALAGAKRAAERRREDRLATDEPSDGVHADYLVEVMDAQRRRDAAAAWSVAEAAAAARTFLRDVARYCLDRPAWDAVAEQRLAGAGLPVRDLLGLVGAMERARAFHERVEAVALTGPAQTHVQAIAGWAVRGHRAVPPRAAMPIMGVRLWGKARDQGLNQAVARYDDLLEGWYRFVFVSSVPPGRAARLDHLSLTPAVRTAIGPAERARSGCRTAVGAGDKRAARTAVATLEQAIPPLEQAIYAAAQAPPAASGTPS